MADYYQFDQGSIDVKVGDQFEITGRFPSITDKLKIAFPNKAFKLISEKEKQSQDENKFGAQPPVQSIVPTIYTLEALTEGTYEVEYLYYAAPQTIHNSDKYIVNIKKI